MTETDRVLAPPGRVWWADWSDRPMRTQTTTTQERTDPADALLGGGCPDCCRCPACRTEVVPCRDYCPECGAAIGEVTG